MNNVSKQQSEELQKLAEQPEKAIDTSEIPEVTDWNEAVHARFYRPVKQQITLLIDTDLLAWFKAQGDRYQTRINAALREYVESHLKTG